MIAAITGQVTTSDERSLVLSAHGIGLRVFVLPKLVDTQRQAKTVLTLVTHLHVREDALELYGFESPAELHLFQKLIEVNGVGPRMAMNVLSSANVKDIEDAIERGQATLLTKVSGVGKKTAERIIVELRGKLSEDMTGDDSDASAVIDALVSLGYSSREAREAALATSAELDIAERVKAALKRMGSR